MANSISTAQRPDDDSTVPGSKVAGTARGSGAISGARQGDTDPTNEPGQLGHAMEALLGMERNSWTTSAAPGTQGAVSRSDTDPTNAPGQTEELFSGEGPDVIANTGAPGTATPASSITPDSTGGPTLVTFTNPGSFIGTYQSETVSTSVEGPQDSTMANNEGYATGGPQLPALKGKEPQVRIGPFQPQAGGRVLRGGRAINP